MNRYMEASVSAFNVSKHCDRSSVGSFYDSYISRKQFIIAAKLHAAKKGSPINEKKLQWEVYILEYVQKNPQETKDLIKKLLLNNPTRISSGLLDKANGLLEGKNE